MNKKASLAEMLSDNVIFVIFLLAFLMTMSFYIGNFNNNAAFWAEYYAKEITNQVNLAQIGDTLEIDVEQGTKIAINNQVESKSEIFNFDNEENKFCVKLSRGRQTCNYYFNNVLVERDIREDLGEDGKDVLILKIKEKI